MNTAELLNTADQVHSAAIRANEWSAWRNFGSVQCQSAFMRAAVAAGVVMHPCDGGKQ